MDKFGNNDNIDNVDERMTRSEEGSGTVEEYRKAEAMNEGCFIKRVLPFDDAFMYILTGSRAWRKNKVDSDYDYICDAATFENTIEKIKQSGLKYVHHDHFSSLYIAGEDGLFNIIGLDPHELNAWEFATKALSGLVAADALNFMDFNDKNKVYGLFGMLKGLRRLL